MFRIRIQMWLVQYKDDLYLHHIIKFCKSSLLNDYYGGSDYISSNSSSSNTQPNYHSHTILRPSQSCITTTTAACNTVQQTPPFYLISPLLQQQQSIYIIILPTTITQRTIAIIFRQFQLYKLMKGKEDHPLPQHNIISCNIFTPHQLTVIVQRIMKMIVRRLRKMIILIQQQD